MVQGGGLMMRQISNEDDGCDITVKVESVVEDDSGDQTVFLNVKAQSQIEQHLATAMVPHLKLLFMGQVWIGLGGEVKVEPPEYTVETQGLSGQHEDTKALISESQFVTYTDDTNCDAPLDMSVGPSHSLDSLLKASPFLNPLSVFDMNIKILKQNLGSNFTGVHLDTPTLGSVRLGNYEIEGVSSRTETMYEQSYDDIGMLAMKANVVKPTRTKRRKNNNPCPDNGINCHPSCVRCKVPPPKMYSCAECGGNFRNLQVLRSHQIRVHDHPTPYICSYCGKKCVTSQILKAHERIHVNARPFQCPKCDAKFSQNCNLKLHIIKNHEGSVEKKFLCIVCSRGFETNSQLSVHLKQHRPTIITKRFPCTHCNHSFRRRSELKKHLDLVTKNQDYICDFCGNTYHAKHNLIYHVKIHLNIRPHKCNLCPKSYFEKKTLREHMFTHTGEKPFKCRLCDARVSAASSLRRHMKKHDNAPIYACPTCGVGLRSKAQVALHCSSNTNTNKKVPMPAKVKPTKNVGEKRKRRAPGEPKPKYKRKPPTKMYHCEECGGNFRNWSIFRGHQIRVHDHNTRYVCSFCGKKCAASTALKAHELTHTKDYNFPCDKCDAKFTTKFTLQLHIIKEHEKNIEEKYCCVVCKQTYKHKYLLQRHLKCHRPTILKSYPCSHCNRVYFSKPQLKKHLEILTGTVKKYKCDFCEKEYRQKHEVGKHIMTHLNLRPFMCDQCPKRFLTNDVLMKHKLIHTGEKPYKCRLCDNSFNAFCILLRHMRMHNNAPVYACSTCGEGVRSKREIDMHCLKNRV
ncbi:UNVERIFIED_CONTAM: hypothetical protein B566_EDAN019520 [Ephemera danica]|nr:hypothetical protein B566_EDAN019520 [Ephemera danica]